MEPPDAPPGEPCAAPAGRRGPRDDFFCWRFQIWYPSEDCVFRHSRRTYHECSGCFQGRMNQRYLEKGLKPPVLITQRRNGGPPLQG
jgi:hypothetical protein